MWFLMARIMGFLFTAYGFYLFCTGDLTNGLLAMILGELIDIPKIKLDEEIKRWKKNRKVSGNAV